MNPRKKTRRKKRRISAATIRTALVILDRALSVHQIHCDLLAGGRTARPILDLARWAHHEMEEVLECLARELGLDVA